MIRMLCLAGGLLALSAPNVLAQAPAFDMSTERSVMPGQEQSKPAPTQSRTPSPGSASGARPPAFSLPTAAAPAPQAAPPSQETASPALATSTEAGAPPGIRYIVPGKSLVLSGEYDERSWSIYLTPREAAGAKSFNLGYQSAVVVAPESSRLSVLVNNRVIAEERVASPDGIANLSFAIPKGLLQPGANLVTLKAVQRHRTDCTIDSTYELWSRINPASTYLSFSASPVAGIAGVDALRAVGVDATGATTFTLVAPALEQPASTKSMMRLAETLALLGGMPHQKFVFSKDTIPAAGPGRMTVVVGTAGDLQPLVPSLPAAALTAPFVSFMPDSKTGATMLVVSGPTWGMVMAAVDSIAVPIDRPLGTRRDAVSTQRWSAPDAPMLYGESQLSFSQLGVASSEFSGRRFRTSFNIGIPADIYAQGYGQATVLLDAAYAPTVRPGSHIDIYVNGDIASTVPITANGGSILRKFPIKVTMRHFKPGVNTIDLEAVLLTDSDAVCTPGASASDAPRFALFDSSQFIMPDFARIGQRLNLSALAGTGYPYNQETEPTPLYLDRVDADTLSATATLLGRMTLVAGRLVPVEPINAVSALDRRDAIFVGPITQMPPTTLATFGISTTTQSGWRPGANLKEAEPATGDLITRWQDRVNGGSWVTGLDQVRAWLKRNFDLTSNSFHIVPDSEAPFAPSNAETVMVGQALNETGDGTWTILTAPSSRDLFDGATALASQDLWPQIAGRITTYSSKTEKLRAIEANSNHVAWSLHGSVSNLRLVAANWLSTNILSFGLLFIILTVLLGVTTARLLDALGRNR